MFDAKIQQIVDKFGEKVDGSVYDITIILQRIVGKWEEEFGHMSKQMKIAIGVSLGLSVADTILLFAILVKLGR